MDSSLVLVANAKDGTISTFTLTDDALEPLGRSDVGALGMPLAVDADRDLVFAGTNNPRGVTVLPVLIQFDGTAVQYLGAQP